MRLAILADIHGNVLALDAVLADLERRGGAERIVNLGDCVSGPLWPAETMARLVALDAVTVRGNHDRIVATLPRETLAGSDLFAFEALTPDHRTWLEALPLTASPAAGMLACHATPTDDETYLLEEVRDGRLVRSDRETIARRLGQLGEHRIVLCGHSHQPGLVRLADGVLIVNPGSVGCPAYHDPAAPAHVSEAGEPHARYVILEQDSTGSPTVDMIAVPYDHEQAARQAEAGGRHDWAHALRTGFTTAHAVIV